MRMNEMKMIFSVDLTEIVVTLPTPALVPRLLPTIQGAPFTEQFKLSSVIDKFNADCA